MSVHSYICGTIDEANALKRRLSSMKQSEDFDYKIDIEHMYSFGTYRVLVSCKGVSTIELQEICASHMNSQYITMKSLYHRVELRG